MLNNSSFFNPNSASSSCILNTSSIQTPASPLAGVVNPLWSKIYTFPTSQCFGPISGSQPLGASSQKMLQILWQEGALITGKKNWNFKGGVMKNVRNGRPCSTRFLTFQELAQRFADWNASAGPRYNRIDVRSDDSRRCITLSCSDKNKYFKYFNADAADRDFIYPLDNWSDEQVGNFFAGCWFEWRLRDWIVTWANKFRISNVNVRINAQYSFGELDLIASYGDMDVLIEAKTGRRLDYWNVLKFNNKVKAYADAPDNQNKDVKGVLCCLQEEFKKERPNCGFFDGVRSFNLSCLYGSRLHDLIDNGALWKIQNGKIWR